MAARGSSILLSLVAMLTSCVGDIGEISNLDARWDSGSSIDSSGPPVDADPTAPDAPHYDSALPPDGSTACNLPGPGTHTLSIDIDGQSRTYILYVPAGLTLPAPLMIALHGNGDTASNFLPYSQLGQSSESNKFLLAVPQAIPDSAPYGVDDHASAKVGRQLEWSQRVAHRAGTCQE